MSKTITDYAAASGIDAAADYLLIYNASGAVYKKINRNTLLSVSGTPADLSTVQTFTNKVLDNTNTITLKDTLFTLQDDGDTTKQAKFQLSGITTGTTRTYTLPNATGTLMDLGSAQSVTGVKTMTSPVISGGSIDNSTITVDAIGEHTAANGVSIDSLNIKDGKLNTNNSVVTANVTDAAITPAKLIAGTGAGWALSTWAPSWTNVVVGNGTVTAGYIQIGKMVYCRLALVYAGAGVTTVISGLITFTLPVTAKQTSPFIVGQALFDDSGVADYFGHVQLPTTTTAALYVEGTGSTYATATNTSATVPFTFAANDGVFCSFWYEAA